MKTPINSAAEYLHGSAVSPLIVHNSGRALRRWGDRPERTITTATNNDAVHCACATTIQSPIKSIKFGGSLIKATDRAVPNRLLWIGAYERTALVKLG